MAAQQVSYIVLLRDTYLLTADDFDYEYISLKRPDVISTTVNARRPPTLALDQSQPSLIATMRTWYQS